VSEVPLIPIPVVLGPTGSGKSALALAAAHALDGEIVNFDSVQVYRGFDVGSAKLAPSEREGVPHHLIDIVEPAALFTAGDYARAAQRALRDVTSRGRIPILVGGTGFYLRALLQGLAPGPLRDEVLRRRLLERERKRPGALHRILARLDPQSAVRIHPNDRNKTLRALEIRLIEGAPLASIFERETAPLLDFRPVKIGLDPPRDLLYARLNERAARMFHPQAAQRGLQDEVRGLLAAGVPPEAKPFESLGYKQVLRIFAGRLSEEQALELTRQETRRYAKRQMTWFRKEPGVHWILGFGDSPGVQAEALAILDRAGVTCS
jgi:tRNA dimethylallyltransferase